MSPKELLYIEDALDHAAQLKTVCGDFSNQLTDPEFKNFVQSALKTEKSVFDRFFTLL